MTEDEIESTTTMILHNMNQVQNLAYPYYTGQNIFKNQITLQGNTENKAIDIEKFEPHRQTLVLIYADANCSQKVRERIARFVSGLNLPETIKADIITLGDRGFWAGVTFGLKDQYALPDEELIKELKKKYVQVLELRYEA